MRKNQELEGFAGPTRSLSGHRLLLVDHDRDSREALHELLVRAGFRVVSVSDTGEAIEEVADGGFEALVLDIAPPGSNPYRVPELIAAKCNEARPILIAVGSGSRPHDLARARGAGFDCHLTKPLHLEILLDALSDLIR